MAWMAFVAYFFYKNNLYYKEAFVTLWTTIFNIGIGAAIFAALFFAKKKLNLPSLLGIILLVSLVLSIYNFYRFEFSIVRDGSIVKNGSIIEFVESGKDISNSEVLFEENQLIRNTDFVFEQLPEKFHQYFEKANLFTSLASAEFKYILIMFFGLLGAVILSAFGQSVFYRKTENDAARILSSFFLGAALLSIPIFFLANFSLYNLWTFLGILLLIAAFSYQKIWSTLKFIWQTKINFTDKNILFTAAFSFLILSFAMLLLDAVRTIPLGWDDSNFYVRGAKIMAESNFFTRGIGPTAWTLIMSIPWLFVSNLIGNQALLFASLLVGSGLTYLFAEKFLNKNLAILAPVLLLSIPMIDYFLVIDSKLELPFLFTGIAALITLLNWRENENKNDLIALGVLCGLLLTTKITAITFLAVIAILIIYLKTQYKYLCASIYFAFLAYLSFGGQFHTLRAFDFSYGILTYIFALFAAGFLVLSFTKEKPVKNLKTFYPVLTVLGIAALMMLPWSILQVIQAGEINLSVLLFGTKGNTALLSSGYTCSTEDIGFASDYKRYTGQGSGLLGLLLFPWNATITHEVTTFISDTGFILLGAIPLWLLSLKDAIIKNKKILLLFMFALLYLLIWVLTSAGVAWYGIFFLPAAIILTLFLSNQKEIWWKIGMGAVLGFTILSTFFLRSSYYAEPHMMSYAFGLATEKDVEGFLYPGTSEAADILNAEENVVLYRIGTHIKYFLDTSNENIVEDDYMDQYVCIREDFPTTEELKDRFLSVGVTHVIIDMNASLGLSKYGAEFHERREEFISFLESTGWQKLYDEKGLALYKNGK